MDEGRFHPARLWADYGSRLMRYGGVTVVTTIVGVSTFFVGLTIFEWDHVIANLVSVTASTPFAYYLNRHYVWARQRGNHSASREVTPFWIMNFVGYGFSTLVVWVAGGISQATVFLLVAQLAAFGTLWLFKFAFLAKYLWPDEVEAVAERV